MTGITQLSLLLVISLALVLVPGSTATAVDLVPLGAGTTGPQRVIVILVEFPDLEHTAESNAVREIVSNQLNAFYRESSYGLAWIDGEIINRWYEIRIPLKKLRIQEWNYDEEDMSRFEREVVNAADKDVNFGNYHFVIIVAAGRVWPHASCDFDITTNDGVSSLRGFVVNEESEMKTYAHELAHVLPSEIDARGNCGLPDLYSYDAMERNQHGSIWVGPWDLMDSGPGFSAWSKIALGWLEPDEVPAEPPNILVVNLQPLEEHSGSRAVVVELTLTELYVVEVRRRIGYDSALPAEGVLVYMIDLKQKAGYGVVKVVDANSETPTLDDATYGKGDFFEDRKNDFYVLVADTDGVGFTVCVSRTKVQSLKDSDHDGLLDAVEAQYGTDPGNPDSDGDGLQDGEEIAHYHTNPLEADSDADGLKDGDEVLKYKTEPLNPDSDGDGLSDGDEALKYRTNPAAADSDYDGVEDSEEIRLGSDPLKVDTDNDGLLDGNEIKHGTNPLRSDTDADFWPDGVDFAPTNSLMPNGIFLVLVALALVSVIAYQRGAFAFVSGRPNVPVRLPRGATCLRCGVANRLGSSFCRRCGTPLRTGVGLVCPLCATANRPTATFCRRCRFKLRRS